MEKISKGKEYLGAGLGGTTLSETVQQVPPRKSQQANNNLSSHQSRLTHGQANDPAPPEAKA